MKSALLELTPMKVLKGTPTLHSFWIVIAKNKILFGCLIKVLSNQEGEAPPEAGDTTYESTNLHQDVIDFAHKIRRPHTKYKKS